MTKTYVEYLASQPHGSFLPSSGETCFRTMDGSDVATFLTRLGFDVVENYDTGRNGLAVTACGIRCSTNGHISRVPA